MLASELEMFLRCLMASLAFHLWDATCTQIRTASSTPALLLSTDVMSEAPDFLAVFLGVSFHTGTFHSFLIKGSWERIGSVASLASNYLNESQFPFINLARGITREKPALLMIQWHHSSLFYTHFLDKLRVTNRELIPIFLVWVLVTYHCP